MLEIVKYPDETLRQISEKVELPLSKEDRVLFVRRYYYGDAVKNLAKLHNYTENQMAQKMMKLRKSLKTFLSAKGVRI